MEDLVVTLIMGGLRELVSKAGSQKTGWQVSRAISPIDT
jgi:hypothetical protein